MPLYHIQQSDSGGNLIRISDADYANDGDAYTRTESSLTEGGHAHVWAGSRFVCRVYFGDQVRAVRRQAVEVLGLLANGLRPWEVARQLRISQMSVYQIVANE